MRRYVWLGLSLLLAGCGSAHLVATPVAETGVTASCVGLSPTAQFAMARLVFVGRMLPGPTIGGDSRGVLGSPATMHVDRYLKGHGPATVRVDTAARIERNGIAGIEDGIEPHAGQRWKIYTTSRRQPFATSICAGSGPAGISSGR